MTIGTVHCSRERGFTIIEVMLVAHVSQLFAQRCDFVRMI